MIFFLLKMLTKVNKQNKRNSTQLKRREVIRLLYTTKEIAEMYGGEQKNVTPYMITHTWIPNGLKCVKR